MSLKRRDVLSFNVAACDNVDTSYEVKFLDIHDTNSSGESVSSATLVRVLRSLMTKPMSLQSNIRGPAGPTNPSSSQSSLSSTDTRGVNFIRHTCWPMS